MNDYLQSLTDRELCLDCGEELVPQGGGKFFCYKCYNTFTAEELGRDTIIGQEKIEVDYGY